MTHTTLPIINTITLYLKSQELAPFFITHNIPFDTKFRFNASYYDPWIIVSPKLITRKLKQYFFTTFPSIIVTGIGVKWIGQIFIPVNFEQLLPYSQFKNIKHIVSHSCFCSIAVIDINHFSYLNIRSITFPKSHIISIEPLLQCKHLKHIGMRHCFGIKDVHKIFNLPKLRVFGYPFIDTPILFPEQGKEKGKLKILEMFYDDKEFSDCGHIANGLPSSSLFSMPIIEKESLLTTNLRVLHLYSHTFVDLPVCETVTNLKLYKCAISKKLEAHKFPSVTNISLILMNYSFDMSFVSALPSLHCLEFDCTNFNNFGDNTAITLFQSFEKIKNSTSLKKLVFCGSANKQIMKIIGNCVNLEFLTFNRLAYDDFSHLVYLTKLRILSIHQGSNSIRKYHFPNFCSKLELIDLDNTYAQIIVIKCSVDRVVVKKCGLLKEIYYDGDGTLFDVGSRINYIKFSKIPLEQSREGEGGRGRKKK